MRYNTNISYQARCALAEKLGDQKLRMWCVEQLGLPQGDTLTFAKVDALFMYVKLREKGTNV